LRGDAAQAAKRWHGAVEPASSADLASADLVIDALFGAGLARDLDGEARRCVERINEFSASGRPVLAVDLPSGVDGETGAERGLAVRASASVTFFRLKPGHLLLPGRARCGRIVLADIGIGASALAAIGPRAFANAPSVWRGAIPTNIRAAPRWFCPGPLTTPARRGWRRGRRCARAPALSRSPARSTPSPSTPLNRPR
jgi:ADP-dependent NAD(P)H-hydrate dehydratase / NAD(P)H-hydrate epimerase